MRYSLISSLELSSHPSRASTGYSSQVHDDRRRRNLHAYSCHQLTVAVMLGPSLTPLFFHMPSKSDDKLALLRNIRKATPYLAASFLPLFLLLQRIVFFFYGRQYPFSWEDCTPFLPIASNQWAFFIKLLRLLMSSEGTRGPK